MVERGSLLLIHEADGSGSPGNYRTEMTEGQGKGLKLCPSMRAGELQGSEMVVISS